MKTKAMVIGGAAIGAVAIVAGGLTVLNWSSDRRQSTAAQSTAAQYIEGMWAADTGKACPLWSNDADRQLCERTLKKMTGPIGLREVKILKTERFDTETAVLVAAFPSTGVESRNVVVLNDQNRVTRDIDVPQDRFSQDLSVLVKGDS